MPVTTSLRSPRGLGVGHRLVVRQIVVHHGKRISFSLAELLRIDHLHPVYHGEHGLRTLKENVVCSGTSVP